MVTIIVTAGSLVVLLGAVIYVLLFLKKHSTDRHAEKIYSVYIKDVLHQNNLLRQCAPVVPTRIIVDSQGDRSSAFRSAILKSWYKLRKIDVKQDPVLIFGKNSDEQKACLVRLAVELSMVEIITLDISYRNTIINYEAYKYAYHSSNAPQGTKLILQQEWEKSPKRDHIERLDNPKVCDEVILNPPQPKRRSLLQNVCYPLLAMQSRIVAGVQDFHTHEYARSLVSKILRSLAEKTMAVVLIGDLSSKEYIEMIGNKILAFKDGFIITGLGSQMARVEYISNKLRSKSEAVWNVRLGFQSIQGTWTFEEYPDRQTEVLLNVIEIIPLAD